MLVPGVPSHGLAVRYRGSASPQTLDLSVVAQNEIDPDGLRIWELSTVDGIAFGGAGGALFDPRSGAASIVHEQINGRRADVRSTIAATSAPTR